MDVISSSILCFVGAILLVGMLFLASSIRIVPEYKRLRVYRLGRDLGEKGPGIVILIPIIDKGMVVDMKAAAMADHLIPSIGSVGETQSTVHVGGLVKVGDKSWDAMSSHPIAPKSSVRVKRVVLEVEEDTSSNP